MEVKFWEPQREYLLYKEEIDNAIQGVLSSGKLILGHSPEIEKFEESFAKFVGKRHAIMVGAGTHALYLAYRALGIGSGDEVITVSHTFIATIDQIVAVGATPVLVDINPETGLIDPSEIAKAITPRTKAIVPVHLEGKVADVPVWVFLSRSLADPLIHVIEDAAQAIGAKGVGLDFALRDIQCYSLFPAKILGSVGNAGCITTNDDNIAQGLRMMRCNGNIGKTSDLNAEFGTNMEPDAIQAAVLNVKMKYLPEMLKRRQEIAQMYDEGLKGLPIDLPLQQQGRVYQDYVIRPRFQKNELVKFLQDNGIGTLGHNLIPNHHYPKLGLKFNLPHTDVYISRQIRIPCRPEFTNEEINYVIEKINEFYR